MCLLAFTYVTLLLINYKPLLCNPNIFQHTQNNIGLRINFNCFKLYYYVKIELFVVLQTQTQKYMLESSLNTKINILMAAKTYK